MPEVDDRQFLHIAAKQKSRFYIHIADTQRYVIEPNIVDICEEEDFIIHASPLALFNLDRSPGPCTLEPVDEGQIPCLAKATLSPVHTESYLSLDEEYDDLDEALHNMTWPSVLNRGELIQLNLQKSSSHSTLFFKVIGLVDDKNKPVTVGRFLQSECKLSVNQHSCGSRIPPVILQNEEMNLNTHLKTQLTDLFRQRDTKLVTVLLSGPLGFGKRETLRAAAAEAGLNLYHPHGQTLKHYEQSAVDLAGYSPCGLVVKRDDFPRVLKALRKQVFTDSVFLFAIADELEAKTDRSFNHLIRFQGLIQKERESFLLKVLPSELVKGCLGQVNGFSIGDLKKLAKLIRIREQLDHKLTESDLSRLIKDVRLGKGGHQGQVPKVTWDQVAGLAEAKELIRETLEFPINRSDELNPRYGKRTGILLYGPPGSGKTLLAKALATEYQVSFMAVKGPELMSMYIGETESNIRDLFAQARLSQPSILFFDELDSLATARGQDGDSGGVTDRIVAQLMVEMDRLAEDPNLNVFIIGATNRPDMLDPALMRPGRLDKSIYLGAPTSVEERVAILEASCRDMKLADDVQFASLSLSTAYSPADLANVCRMAMRMALKRKIQELEKNPKHNELSVFVSQMDFVNALACVKPSL